MKSGNLNFLEPSGPLQACNGTALPLRHLEVPERQYTYYVTLRRFCEAIVAVESNKYCIL